MNATSSSEVFSNALQKEFLALLGLVGAAVLSSATTCIMKLRKRYVAFKSNVDAAGKRLDAQDEKLKELSEYVSTEEERRKVAKRARKQLKASKNGGGSSS